MGLQCVSRIKMSMFMFSLQKWKTLILSSLWNIYKIVPSNVKLYREANSCIYCIYSCIYIPNTNYSVSFLTWYLIIYKRLESWRGQPKTLRFQIFFFRPLIFAQYVSVQILLLKLESFQISKNFILHLDVSTRSIFLIIVIDLHWDMVTAVKASGLLFHVCIFHLFVYFLHHVYFQLDMSAGDFQAHLAYQMYKQHQQSSLDSTEFPLRLLAQPVAKVMCELGLEAPQSSQSVGSLCQALLCLPPKPPKCFARTFPPQSRTS